MKLGDFGLARILKVRPQRHTARAARQKRAKHTEVTHYHTYCVSVQDDGDYARTHVGTPYYMSPEQVTEARYNEISDIWSLGCLIYERAALCPPFKATNHLALAMKIQTGKFAPVHERYSQELQRCLKGMMALEQSKRPAIEQVTQARAHAAKQRTMGRWRAMLEGSRTHALSLSCSLPRLIDHALSSHRTAAAGVACAWTPI